MRALQVLTGRKKEKTEWGDTRFHLGGEATVFGGKDFVAASVFIVLQWPNQLTRLRSLL